MWHDNALIALTGNLAHYVLTPRQSWKLVSRRRCEIRFLDASKSGNGFSKLLPCSEETLMRAKLQAGHLKLFALLSHFPFLWYFVPSPTLLFSLICTPDPKLCEPRQWKQSRDSSKGAELWHHHPSEGEDTGCCLQEHALFSAATCCRHGPR